MIPHYVKNPDPVSCELNLNYNVDKFKTGDICMTLWTKKKMSLKDRIMVNGILDTTGAKHNHDEPILVKSDGVYVGYATPPHYELVPFEERMAEHARGDRVFAVFRHITFMKPSHEDWYREFQIAASSSIRTLASVKTPYDTEGLYKILWAKIMLNMLAKRIYLKNSEHAVYCTEGLKLVYNMGYVDLFKPLGEQAFPSPIHTERLWRDGYLVMIADFGLRNYLLA